MWQKEHLSIGRFCISGFSFPDQKIRLAKLFAEEAAERFIPAALSLVCYFDKWKTKIIELLSIVNENRIHEIDEKRAAVDFVIESGD